MVISFVLLGSSIVSTIVCLAIISRILQAIAKKESNTVKRLCNHLLVVLVCGAGTLSAYTLLDVFEKTPHVSIGLIALKLLGCVGPFLIGGGVAIYMFRKAAKNMN